MVRHHVCSHRMSENDAIAATCGEELRLELTSRITPLLEQRIQGMSETAIAELSFANLWLFRRSHHWQFHDGDWPCISGVGYDGLHHALPLFDLRKTPTHIIEKLLNQFGCLFPLSDAEIKGIDSERYQLTSQEADSDYPYPAEQFKQYQGSALHSKKNLMNQFLGANEVSMVPYTPRLKPEAEHVLDEWLRDKNLNSGDADDLPCREALAWSIELGLEGYVYFANGHAAGFLLSEELQPGVWVVRFAKGLARFKGISQFMFHHFASCTDRNVQWLNFEQDLGYPNFRKTKTSYQPYALLLKWRLQLN